MLKCDVRIFRAEIEDEEVVWLPPRDSNPDMLIQRQATDDSAEVLRFY